MISHLTLGRVISGFVISSPRTGSIALGYIVSDGLASQSAQGLELKLGLGLRLALALHQHPEDKLAALPLPRSTTMIEEFLYPSELTNSDPLGL